VNEAYRALQNPVQRAQYLLSLHGIDAVGEADTQLPLPFLERQLERREAAGDAAAAGDARTLSALLAAVRADARDIEDGLAQQLDDAQAYAAARTQVRELTFLTKLAEDLDAMLGSLLD
jgi:molecular chaperone HscB